MNRTPDFIVIGAAKGGTSALYSCLANHPQIFMSRIKETNFFALLDEPPRYDAAQSNFTTALRNESQERYRESLYRGISSFDDYYGLFRDADVDHVTGEVSPFYLYHPHAAQRIRDFAPSARLIAILRNPVERAYSQYMQYRRDGRDDSSDFITAIEKEPVNIDDVWCGMRHYIRAGYYYRQLRRYIDIFHRDQICIFLYEDLKDDPVATISTLLEFIGLDPLHQLDMTTARNVSGIPRSRLLQKLFFRPNPVRKLLHTIVPSPARRAVTGSSWYTYFACRNLHRRKITNDEREVAINFYLNDITKLQELLQRDLSHWME